MRSRRDKQHPASLKPWMTPQRLLLLSMVCLTTMSCSTSRSGACIAYSMNRVAGNNEDRPDELRGKLKLDEAMSAACR